MNNNKKYDKLLFYSIGYLTEFKVMYQLRINLISDVLQKK